VEKIVVEGRTRVEVRALAESERAEELARMLGADDDDTTARKHAERVLKRGTQR
jgi:DNA repair ATPase RecN